MLVEHWREVVEELTEKEKGTDPADVEKAKADRIFGESGLDDAENAIETLRPLLERISKDWKKPNNRVLGHILRSPATALGVGNSRFTEDWGIFQVDRTKAR